ncbi:MAG: GtrA family protein [Deltaproteobacteria bacterium]|nr:GtrA family protein [Deltaproteobacteria bacterium]
MRKPVEAIGQRERGVAVAIPSFRTRLGLAFRSRLLRQFASYALVGGLATVADWSTFYLGYQVAALSHPVALVLAILVGGTCNYTLNRLITFRNKSRRIIQQLAVFAVVSAVSIGMSIGVMHVLVDWIEIHAMLARVLTTGLMLFVNFLLQKHFTFGIYK